MNEPYVILNNYNYALSEEFDYLDAFEAEIEETVQAQKKDNTSESESD